MVHKENKILDLLNLGNQTESIRAYLDAYNESKEILEKTYIALGRKVEYEVIIASSSNSYNIPLYERYSTS